MSGFVRPRNHYNYSLLDYFYLILHRENYKGPMSLLTPCLSPTPLGPSHSVIVVTRAPSPFRPGSREGGRGMLDSGPEGLYRAGKATGGRSARRRPRRGVRRRALSDKPTDVFIRVNVNSRRSMSSGETGNALYLS